jgi:predicted secreted protein
MSDIVLEESDAGRPVDVRVGDLIDIYVDDISTTGYRWTLALVGTGRDALEDRGTRLTPYPGVGAGGRRVYRLAAVRAGVAEVALVLARPTAAPSPALKTLTYRISVAAP